MILSMAKTFLDTTPKVHEMVSWTSFKLKTSALWKTSQEHKRRPASLGENIFRQNIWLKKKKKKNNLILETQRILKAQQKENNAIINGPKTSYQRKYINGK